MTTRTSTRTARFCDKVRQMLGRSDRQKHHRFRKWRNQTVPTTTAPEVVDSQEQDNKLGCMLVEWNIKSQVSITNDLAAQGKKLGRARRARLHDTNSSSIKSKNDQIIGEMLEMIDQYLTATNHVACCH